MYTYTSLRPQPARHVWASKQQKSEKQIATASPEKPQSGISRTSDMHYGYVYTTDMYVPGNTPKYSPCMIKEF